MLDNSEEEVNSGSNPSTGLADALPNSESLSKATLGSAALSRKESNDLVTKTDDPVFEFVDDSNISARIKLGACLCGTTDSNSIKMLLQQICDIIPKNGKDSLQNLRSSVAMIRGIDPRNPLEGMLALQMVAVHISAMEFLQRASRMDQTDAGIDANVHRAVRLHRTFTSQMEALNRSRGKINPQTVVGNVNVNDGGQAIVGTVEHRGDRRSREEVGPEKDK